MNEPRKSGSGMAVLAVLLLACILLAMLGFAGFAASRLLWSEAVEIRPPMVLIEDPVGAAVEEPKDTVQLADEKLPASPNE